MMYVCEADDVMQMITCTDEAVIATSRNSFEAKYKTKNKTKKKHKQKPKLYIYTYI